ncbi:DHHC palmitoyltransferase-domain-containing protein [Polychytrium aggregatum]|uniref:DHHC palmitoyltransferase-domain-containing protein n=1 Tax=Polychytrium aggregatum TaxID=110093 RepID=UPI0022FEC980|nr:DHHC palmitoyltransferase-domain-containing protein [Polychytrium aggregatum]KAI9193371.1 DHHC palmitoyltransferase-domain-containing protein [Polychytrium aggregatum]
MIRPSPMIRLPRIVSFGSTRLALRPAASAALGKLLSPWVLCVLVGIVLLSVSTQRFVLGDWFRSTGWTRFVALVGFNLCVAMVLCNYVLCVFTHPGSVDRSWEPAGLEGFGTIDPTCEHYVEIKSDSDSRPRFCKTCSVFKPPRAHHCRQCRSCILRMDHHCPWIENCVGFYNQGHFVRFLVYASLSCTMCLAFVVQYMWGFFASVFQHLAKGSKDPPDEGLRLLIAGINLLVLIPLTSIVVMLTSTQLHYLVTNQTTIECLEKDEFSFAKSGKVSKLRHPFHIGYFENIKAILGDNIWLWLLPQRMKGDPYTYPIAILEDSVIESHNSRSPVAEEPFVGRTEPS